MDRVIITTLVVALVATPMAGAWGAKGSYEPDTKRDRDDGWMYGTTDITPTDAPTKVRRVYFNGWLAQCQYPCFLDYASFNPNVASVQSAVGSPFTYPHAMLGVWKDCNNDGYVGYGDQGLFEYRVELLAGNTSVCKPEALPPLDNRGRYPFGFIPPHNDGTWVHEFIPIQWNRANAEALGDVNPFNINDNTSRVWLDFGLPETDKTGTGSGCWTVPQPRGTYRSAGGLVEYADCRTGFKATDGWNGAVATLGGDDLGAGQVSFADKPRDQSESASLLNVKNPWGKESDAAFVETWDCSQPQTQLAYPAQLGGGNIANVSQPRVPGSPNAGGSLAGQANSTGAGFDECERNTYDNDEAHTGDTLAGLPYSQEDDVVNSVVKIDPDVHFAPQEKSHPTAPWSTVLGKGTPVDFGAKLVERDGLWQGSQSVQLTDNYVNSRTGEFGGRWYATFYAFVGRTDLNLPKLTTKGVYGADACTDGIGSGKAPNLGWACDPAEWYRDSAGNDVEVRSTYLGDGELPTKTGVRVGSRVGALYNLRDVDCFDASVKPLRDADVGWPTISGGPLCE